MGRITAVVVTYNSETEVGPCLDALKGRAEVVVVDNASADNTADVVRARPWVRLIANPANQGFAGGVNQGVAASESPLVLILNPDAVVETDLEELASVAMEHGIAAGTLVGEDGRVQEGFTIRRFPGAAELSFESLGVNRLWPGNPVNRRYRYLNRDLTVAGEAEQPAGAFLMVRRDVLQAVGGFDESFHPVWFEDVDFLKRAAARGYRARYTPAAMARHRGGHSVKRIPGECRNRFWYASLLRYAAKHLSSTQFRVVCGSVAAGCMLKVVSGIFWDRNRSGVYGEVIRSAAGAFWSGRPRPESVSTSKWREGDAQALASHPAQR